MDFFYVKQNVRISLPHKQRQLLAPSQDLLDRNEIPLDNVYCGSTAWEIVQARQAIGSDQVVSVSGEQIDKSLLPEKLISFSHGHTITDQLRALIHRKNPQGNTANPSQKIRIALINGTGTMLGDALVGASAMDLLLKHLKAQDIGIELDVVLGWNARPGNELFWQRTPGVNQIFLHSITLRQLRAYDAFWDLSGLLRMEGYGTEHFADFYLHHLGFDPAAAAGKSKLPTVRADKASYTETRNLLEEFSGGSPLVFLQADASTEARSIPDDLFLELLEKLLKTRKVKVVTSRSPPKTLSDAGERHCLGIQAWTENNLDRYISAVSLCNFVVSVDTLALHIAMGCSKPGVGLFSLSEPVHRLKYSPQIKGFLIPGAAALPYWNRHKSDNAWDTNKALYGKAWLALDVDRVVSEVLESLHARVNPTGAP